MGKSRWEWVRVAGRAIQQSLWMGVGGFIEKLGNWLFLFKNGWKSIAFVEKWVGVCRFCQKMCEGGFSS